MSVTEKNKEVNVDDDEIEIRLSDITEFLKKSRASILRTGLIFFAIGLLYAFSKPNFYSSQVTVMPEIQAKTGGLGGLGSLAGLAGIDIAGVAAGSNDAIRPEIYPDVLKSVPFALQLLREPVYSQLLGKETSLQAFLEEQQNMSWIGRLLGPGEDEELPMADPKNRSNSLQITRKQEKLIKLVHTAVLAAYDKKTGIITVTATLPDPVVAATVARKSLDYLTNYIVSYRTEKARLQVRFLTNQVEEAKSRYQRAEYALSSYRDRNRNLFLETAKIEEQRLQADFILSQNVYSELSKQLEQAKIKVSEESPVFKVLEPALIPLRKSGPKRTLMIIGFTVAGLFLGLFVQGFRRFVSNHKN